MKTLLFAPCIVDSDYRLARNIKWLEYYLPLKDKLGFDKILLVDNASPKENLDILRSKFPEVMIIENKIRLERLSHNAYPYWYRAFAESLIVADLSDYDKAIHIDTDVYIFNNKICDYVKSVDSGWSTFWCARHKFPETTFQIICRDKFEEAKDFYGEGYLQFYPFDIAEHKITFTHIERSFNGDRYGEFKTEQEPEWDFAGQVPNEMVVKFNE